jgi:solute carrier family 8 (sodium/calcium exchanger)
MCKKYAQLLLLLCLLIFAGSVPSMALRFLQHLGMATICKKTFFAQQAAVLEPVLKFWAEWQNWFFSKARESGRKLTLGGDGRADSPGHSTKFGLYTLMDLDYMKVCHFELVQVIIVQQF